MSYKTLPVTPDFAEDFVDTYSFIVTKFQDGSSQVRPRWHKPRRSWELHWNALSEDEVEQLKSFVRYHYGAKEAFYYSLQEKIPRPYKAPTLGYKAGGALGSRTLYAGYTWADDSNETTISVQTDSISLSDGYILTVRVPSFPAGVTQAKIYVGTSSSALHLQSDTITDSGGLWTEPTSGYATGGDSPPSSNTLSESVLVLADSDNIEAEKISASAWRAKLKVLEKFS